jgi:hypothetical protein
MTCSDIDSGQRWWIWKPWKTDRMQRQRPDILYMTEAKLLELGGTTFSDTREGTADHHFHKRKQDRSLRGIGMKTCMVNKRSVNASVT